MRWVWRVALGLVFFTLAAVFYRLGLERSDQLGSVVAAFFTLTGLAIQVSAWTELRRIHDTDAAVKALAARVRTDIDAEIQLWRLSNPAPMPVHWSRTRRSCQPSASSLLGAGRTEEELDTLLRGELSRVVPFFRALPHRHLVILGEPGSGKTVLARLLILGLLKDPTGEAGEPVPVFLPLSSWDPDTDLGSWVRARIAKDHPRISPDVIDELITTHRIAPVLDGLDELPDNRHGDALCAIDDTFHAEYQLVLTCRGDEYETAVRESRSQLSGASVIELEPIAENDVVHYLSRGALRDEDRWDTVLAEVARDGSPLALALSTPLMVFLAHVIYRRGLREPDELLGLPDREAIENHLLAEFVPTAFRGARPRRAARWLSYLATNMNWLGTRDLAWWQIESPVIALPAAGLFAGSAWLYYDLWFSDWERNIGAALIGLVVLLAYLYQHDRWTASMEHERRTVDPRRLLRRRRRRAVAASAVVALGVLLMAGRFALGSTVGTERALALVAAPASALALATALVSAWGSFAVSHLWLSATARLPFRLHRFLYEARARGVLRQAGAVYQFRHARLQDHLAATPYQPRSANDPSISAKDPSFSRLAVPLMILYMVTATLFIRTDTKFGTLQHVAGNRPKATPVEEFCKQPPCPAPFKDYAWSLPPGASATAIFEVQKSSELVRAQGLRGEMYLAGCADATVMVTLAQGGRSTQVTGAKPSRVPVDALESTALTAATRLHLTMRRSDRLTCTTEFHWLRGAVLLSYSLSRLER
jgi:hypothetical protein